MMVTNTQFARLSATAGLIGVIMLVVSFTINPGPPSDATEQQLAAFASQNYTSVLWGAWLQAVGPLLIVAFAISIVFMSGAASRYFGWMTLLGAMILMAVSLTEIVFYISALGTSASIGTTSLVLIHAVQHLYFIVGAPALFIPLGGVVLGSRILPKAFGYSAIVLGLSFAFLGVAFLYDLALPSAVTAFAGLQAFWWLGAAILLFARPNRTGYA